MNRKLIIKSLSNVLNKALEPSLFVLELATPYIYALVVLKASMARNISDLTPIIIILLIKLIRHLKELNKTTKELNGIPISPRRFTEASEDKEHTYYNKEQVNEAMVYLNALEDVLESRGYYE